MACRARFVFYDCGHVGYAAVQRDWCGGCVRFLERCSAIGGEGPVEHVIEAFG